jgi:hypothetical protein
LKKADETKVSKADEDYEIRKRIEKLMNKYASPEHLKKVYHEFEQESNWKIKKGA